MKTNLILEDLWQVKDKLAADAGYDTSRFLGNLKQWESEHPYLGRVVRNAEELQRVILEEEGKQNSSAFVLNEKPL